MQDNKYVILVIDDDPDFLQAMRLLFEANGFAVVEAKSAEEGLNVYKKTKPDLILVDLMMEEIDSGTNFARELRLLNNKALVYLLSAAGDEMMETIDCAQFGFAGVFQKPIDNKRLLSVIKAKLK